jgi:hypothetical protein
MCETRIGRRVWTISALVRVLTSRGAESSRAQQRPIDPREVW